MCYIWGDFEKSRSVHVIDTQIVDMNEYAYTFLYRYICIIEN